MARIKLDKISINSLMEMSHDELIALSRRGLNRESMTAESYNKAIRSNLAEITSRFTSVANRRIKALGSTKMGRISPAYMRAKNMSKSGLFSVKGKGWNELLNTIKESKQFIQSKTSTLKGWEEVRKNVEKSIGAEYFNTSFKSKKFWEAYRKIYEAHGGSIARKNTQSKSALSSERVQELLYNTITEKRDKEGNRVVDWRSGVDKIVRETDIEFKKEYRKVKGRKSDVGSSRFIIDEE